MTKQSNRTRLVGIRLTTEEYEKIERKFKATTCHKLSEYLRFLLLDKQVVVTYRNSSMDDFMAAVLLLRSDLNDIGVNFNQVVKKLHTLQHPESIKRLLLDYEWEKQQLDQQIAALQTLLDQCGTLW